MPPRFPPKSAKKKGKAKEPVLETYDDFFDEAVLQEEKGERWKVSDGPKAGRFLARALELYDQCLRLRPNDFDTTYNVARIHFLLTQLPPTPPTEQLIAGLQRAIESHKAALTLSPENIDALFNTAQVSIELVETVTEADDGRGGQVVPVLEEAIQLLQRCYQVQEQELRNTAAEEATEPTANGDDMDTDIPIALSAGEELNEEDDEGETERATVKYATTPSTLLDTCLAMLHAYTVYLSIIASAPPSASSTADAATTVQNITTSANEDLILRKAALLAQQSEREPELALARANLLSTAAAASVAHGLATLTDWQAALSHYERTNPKDAEALCDRADALIAYARATSPFGAPAEAQQQAWTVYTQAAGLLGAAVKLATFTQPTPLEVWITRAEVDLARARLDTEVSRRNRGVLFQNARVFYKNAGRGDLGDAIVEV
ncbi:hypothetical protein SAICODRAFT_20741 [Saitoella complicata NRRL Y-17804]|uniref:Uncharacterized protein n=1 Tax=Saitoella complicata (strain BCRC 22490 / CBS 7301 / JCM 7358 / NBRC 10748 / NRRL Y-17804) TaxID=698492 RepID=A0A0E9NEM0_SAICN|nr:uncharacterized protein SAICODRAFT_20741 [Saitoella complicata NRRL Y-17804]ODQ51375.1 hypothetical protein SAICODRAFT_20741 [Saitoella complicata NRRL Y-17804]GAO48258.1 hypothetical protein G7K_2438-t1 [Saitoella complicata NRRL Y-17804]